MVDSSKNYQDETLVNLVGGNLRCIVVGFRHLPCGLVNNSSIEGMLGTGCDVGGLGGCEELGVVDWGLWIGGLVSLVRVWYWICSLVLGVGIE